MKQIKDLIDSVEVNKSNLEHIAKTGNINGGLLVELRRILTAQAEKYQSEIAELKAGKAAFKDAADKFKKWGEEQLASRDSELRELRQ